MEFHFVAFKMVFTEGVASAMTFLFSIIPVTN